MIVAAEFEEARDLKENCWQNLLLLGFPAEKSWLATEPNATGLRMPWAETSCAPRFFSSNSRRICSF